MTRPSSTTAPRWRSSRPLPGRATRRSATSSTTSPRCTADAAKTTKPANLLARAQDILLRTLGPGHPVTLEVAGNKERVDATPSPYA